MYFPQHTTIIRDLEEQFHTKSLVKSLNLRRKLHSLRLKDGTSVQEHMKTMVETLNKLSIDGNAIMDEDIEITFPYANSNYLPFLVHNLTVSGMKFNSPSCLSCL